MSCQVSLRDDAGLFVGVDVGTYSVRAGLFDAAGTLLSSHVTDISVSNPRPGFYEQSSGEIWSAVCQSVRRLFATTATPLSSPVTVSVSPSSASSGNEEDGGGNKMAAGGAASFACRDRVKGIGFDATCSLVVVGKDGMRFNLKKLEFEKSLKDEADPGAQTADYSTKDVIMWMDHRAEKQAERINAASETATTSKYTGGKISLEMQGPKIRWLKENLSKDTFDQIEYLFDLPDFLTWKATSSTAMSLCSLVCKSGLLPLDDTRFGWDAAFLKSIVGLETASELRMMGADGSSDFLSPGQPIGQGLTRKAAESMRLNPVGRVMVGASMIDAHAGCLGSAGSSTGSDCQAGIDFNKRLILVCGTSTCHLTLTDKKLFVPGVWGPYKSVVLPNMWTHEGGQSASGSLINHIIESHPASEKVYLAASSNMVHVQDYLSDTLRKRAQDLRVPVEQLTRDVHVWPDFHGNRSPLADPEMKGMVSGLSMDASELNLAILYLATLQSLTYSTKFIMDTMVAAGYEQFEQLVMCGGLSQGDLFLQTHADALGMSVLVPRGREGRSQKGFSPVLLGSAMLGATASGHYSCLADAVRGMAPSARVFQPNPSARAYHNAKYEVFRKMGEDQKKYRAMMVATVPP